MLLARVQELEGRLAKDSHTSGKPPSSGGLGRKTTSLRWSSGKQPGGQLGNRGATLHLVAAADVDTIVAPRPAVCAACQAPLLPDDAPVVGQERRQVHELPPLRLVVREYQALQVRCPRCQAVTSDPFPAEAPSRAQDGPRLRGRWRSISWSSNSCPVYGRVRDLLADLFGAHLSLGTLVQWVRQGAAVLAPVEARIKAALGRAAVLHSDEAGVRQAGHLAWAQMACTDRLTHYAIHPQRGQAATDASGILPAYHGVNVHDGWAAYRAMRTAATRCATSTTCAS